MGKGLVIFRDALGPIGDTMINSRFGSEVELIAYCGEDGIPPCTRSLIKGRRVEDDAVRFYFAEYLKADGGSKEISEAIARLPKLDLSPQEFMQAVEEAS